MPVLLPPGVRRDDVMAAMRDEGIQTSIHYPPIDTFTAFAGSGNYRQGDLRRTHDIGKRALTLPLYPSMTAVQVDAVCNALSRALGRAGRAG
jgi:dTDP-4-amino-4,6-dideoxygalactose transaminase